MAEERKKKRQKGILREEKSERLGRQRRTSDYHILEWRRHKDRALRFRCCSQLWRNFWKTFRNNSSPFQLRDDDDDWRLRFLLYFSSFLHPRVHRLGRRCIFFCVCPSMAIHTQARTHARVITTRVILRAETKNRQEDSRWGERERTFPHKADDKPPTRRLQQSETITRALKRRATKRPTQKEKNKNKKNWM